MTDVAIVKWEGTIGDIKGLSLYEGFLQMRLEEDEENTEFVS